MCYPLGKPQTNLHLVGRGVVKGQPLKRKLLFSNFIFCPSGKKKYSTFNNISKYPKSKISLFNHSRKNYVIFVFWLAKFCLNWFVEIFAKNMPLLLQKLGGGKNWSKSGSSYFKAKKKKKNKKFQRPKSSRGGGVKARNNKNPYYFVCEGLSGPTTKKIILLWLSLLAVIFEVFEYPPLKFNFFI